MRDMNGNSVLISFSTQHRLHEINLELQENAFVSVKTQRKQDKENEAHSRKWKCFLRQFRPRVMPQVLKVKSESPGEMGSKKRIMSCEELSEDLI